MRELTAADIRLRRTESIAAYFPSILAYPFRPGARVTILFCSFFSWIFSSHVMALPGLVVTLSAMLQFLMLVIQHTAAGHGDAPKLGALRSFSFSFASFGLVLIFAGAIGLQWSVAGSMPLALLVAAMNCLLLPALVLLLSLEESLLLALEPLRIWRILANAGIGYLLFAILLGLGCWGVQELLVLREDSFGPLSGRLASELSPATFFSIAAAFALLASFAHYLGYIAYHRHEAMGLNKGFLNTAQPQADERHPLEDIENLARDGRHDEASHRLAGISAELALAKRIAWIDELEKRRLWPELRSFSESLVADLLQAGQDGQAAELVLRMLRHFPTFTTAHADDWLRIARGAFRERPQQGFETLARLTAERFPNDSVLLDIALLRAQFEVDHRRDKPAARRILQPYLEWKSHPRINRIEMLLTALGDD